MRGSADRFGRKVDYGGLGVVMNDEKISQLILDSAKLSSQLANVMTLGIRATAPKRADRGEQAVALREALVGLRIDMKVYLF